MQEDKLNKAYLTAKEKFPVGSIVNLNSLIDFDCNYNIFGRITEISKGAKIDVELGELLLKRSTSRTETEPNQSQDHIWESDTIKRTYVAAFLDPKKFKPFDKEEIYSLGHRHKCSTRGFLWAGLNYVFRFKSKDTKLHYNYDSGFIWLPERAFIDANNKNYYKLKLVEPNLEGLVVATMCY